mgnify:CR=1 FL=1
MLNLEDSVWPLFGPRALMMASQVPETKSLGDLNMNPASLLFTPLSLLSTSRSLSPCCLCSSLVLV